MKVQTNTSQMAKMFPFRLIFRLVAQYYMSLSQLFLLEVHYFSTTSQSSSNHVLHSGTAKLALLGIP